MSTLHDKAREFTPEETAHAEILESAMKSAQKAIETAERQCYIVYALFEAMPPVEKSIVRFSYDELDVQLKEEVGSALAEVATRMDGLMQDYHLDEQ
jgi:hypothetical protein